MYFRYKIKLFLKQLHNKKTKYPRCFLGKLNKHDQITTQTQHWHLSSLIMVVKNNF